MGVYEIIERLCDIAREQADIIKKQAEVIAQAEIAADVAADLATMRNAAAEKLEGITSEYH